MRVLDGIEDLFCGPDPARPGHRRGISLLVGMFLLFLTAPVLAAILVFWPWESVFTVDAQTTYLEIEVTDAYPVRWYLTNAVIYDETERGFTGQIAFDEGAHISLYRLKDGAILVDVGAQPGTELSAVGQLYDEYSEPAGPVPVGLQFLMPKENAGDVAWALAGQITLGDVAASGTRPWRNYLRSGEVRLVGKSFLRDERFDQGIHTLNMGDRFEVIRADGQVAPDYGMVTIPPEDEGAVFHVTYHAKGIKGVISRFGSDSGAIRPSIWARLAGDPVFQAALVALVPLAPLFGALLTSFLRREFLARRLRKRRRIWLRVLAHAPPAYSPKWPCTPRLR